jgi:hypothetical protein
VREIIRQLTGFKGKESDIMPPIRIDSYGTANNPLSNSVILAFSSGEMATALEFPATEVEKICKALMNSASRAKERMS